jgi:predicted transposase YbfD/YdcC
LAFGPDSPSAEWSPPHYLKQAETLDKGHDRIETRRLEATASIIEHLAPSWTGLAQVCRPTRQRIVRGKESIETVYAITSLTAEKARPERLLALSREHWGIENRLHYVRDVTCREDQARANVRNAPRALAALRNTVLRRLGFNPVEGFEHFAEHRQQAINVVWGRRTEWPCPIAPPGQKIDMVWRSRLSYAGSQSRRVARTSQWLS